MATVPYVVFCFSKLKFYCPYLGTAELNGRVALVAQQPWILNRSVRNNVLFGSVYEAERYERTIYACALEPDLAVLPAGDLTEIGKCLVQARTHSRMHAHTRAIMCFSEAPL